MKGQKNFQNPFNLTLPQCTHIINMEYQKNPKIEKMDLQKGNLFLGGVGSYKEAIMNGFKIGAVLTVLGQKRYNQCEIPSKIELFGIKKHKWIVLEDRVEENVSTYFDETYEFIKQSLKEHNVLVHCQFGRSRSASILIAFLMREFRMSFADVYKMVFAKRDQLQINQGFCQQLVEFDKILFANN